MTQPEDRLYQQLVQAGLETAGPSEDLRRRVLAAATATVEESSQANDSTVAQDPTQPAVRLVPTPRRPIRFWLLPCSIAAGLLIAAMVVWSMGQARPVNAAELLHQVLQKTGAYRGWVHIVTEKENGKLPDAVNGIYPGTHMNRADGTWVLVGRAPNVLTIEMDIPSVGQKSEYDSQTHEIRHADMIPYNVGATSRQVQRTPIDLESELSFFRTVTGREPLNITYRRDAAQDRFDIQYFADSAQAGAALEPLADAGSIPIQATIWVDPASKLLQRGVTMYVTRFQDGIRPNPPYHWRVFYGEPAISDIYAAGAPRDSTVRDFRIQGEVKALWDRLEQRHAQGYGDAAALVLSSNLKPDGSIDLTGGTIDLYLRQGAAKYFGNYGISEKPTYTGRPRIPPFANWPDMSLDEVLARARQVDPTFIFITDGVRAWGGDISMARWQDERHLTWWDSGGLPNTIAGRVWPTRRSMGVYDTKTSFALSLDPERPGTILLHAQQFSTDDFFSGANPRVYREIFYWLDPQHDDVPVRKLIRDYQDDRQKIKPAVQREYDDEFTEHAQLPSGQWYPARWRETHRVIKKGSLVVESASDVRLRIYPGVPIDSSWFELPPKPR